MGTKDKTKKPLGRIWQPALASYTRLIGPHYAQLFVLARRSTARGYGVMWIGMVASVVGALLLSKPGHLAPVYVVPLILAPFFIPAGFGIAKQIGVINRIKRDLQAAGFEVKHGPDITRGIYWFNRWSKRAGVTSADIIRVGEAAASDPAESS